MINFSDVIIDAMSKKNSALVVGLDPMIKNFPHFLKCNSLMDIEDSIYHFNKIVIDAVTDHVVAVKPQLAYYEIYGSYGIRAFEKTISYAKSKNLIVINDAKRGDIDSTSMAYAEAHLGTGPLSSDMVTVNPYMGSDSYVPFIEMAKQNEKGLFVLLKTSNASSSELQDLTIETGSPLYVELAKTLRNMMDKTIGQNGYSFIGTVVGATYPSEAKQLRELLPNCIFLVPGFGAQGGKLDDLKVFFDQNGNGALVSSSRGIIYSYVSEDNPNWRELKENEMFIRIKEMAISAKDDINMIRKESIVL